MYLIKTYNKKSVLLLFTIIVLNVGAGLSVVILQTKFAVVLIFLPFVITFWLNSTQISKIALTCVAITFPITFRFMEQDAMTTGTLLILLLFTYTWSILNKKKISDNDSQFIFRILLILVIISIAGMVSKTPAAYYGSAVRHLVDFIFSVLLFFVIVKSDLLFDVKSSRKQYIDNILTILILIVSLHIILSIVFFFSPDFQQYFSIFFHREQTHLGHHFNVKMGVFDRGASIFTLFFLGLLISGTRSAAIIVLFELIFMLYITRSKEFIWKKTTISFLILILCIIASPVVNNVLDIIKSRFLDTMVLVQSKADYVTVMNRSGVWEGAWHTTWRTLSLIGHGPVQAYVIGMNRGYSNFHCLYMTLVFQFGIIGSLIFCTFFYYLMKRMVLQLKKLNKDNQLYVLTGSCILSLGTFLINEIKFEFNRGDSYQQIVWIVFAVYYLTGTLLHKNNLGTH